MEEGRIPNAYRRRDKADCPTKEISYREEEILSRLAPHQDGLSQRVSEGYPSVFVVLRQGGAGRRIADPRAEEAREGAGQGEAITVSHHVNYQTGTYPASIRLHRQEIHHREN